MQTSHPKLQSHDDSEKNVICLLSHIAPSFPKTLLTVSTNIFKSTPKLHSSIYFVSNFTTSSKSVILLLPLTCHNPVSPGLNAILALWCGSYCSHSSTVGGLVPTRLISPPYVNSETTFPYKKRTFDFSKALIYQHSYLIYYLLKA